MQRVEHYLLTKLFEHVRNIDRDLRTKIDILEEIKNRKNQIGSGVRADEMSAKADAVLSYVDRSTIDSKKASELAPLIANLQNFQSNVQSVMGQIEELHKDTSKFDIMDLENARFDTKNHENMRIADLYSDYLKRLGRFNKDYPLDITRDSNNRLAFVPANYQKDTDLDYTGLLEIFRPLISSYQDITVAIANDKSLENVLKIIQKESKLDSKVLRHARDVLIDINKKLYEYQEQDITFPSYRFVGREKNAITYALEHEEQEKTHNYRIFLTDNAYEYMTELPITSGDSLDALKLDSIRLIQSYLGTLTPLVPQKVDMERFNLPQIASDLERMRSVDAQIGGDHTSEIMAVTDPKNYNRVYEVVAELIELNRLLQRIQAQLDTALMNKEQKMYYLMMITQIGTMNDVSGLTIYRYINRGILDYYRSIIDDIKQRITKLGPKQMVSKTVVDTKGRKLLDAEYFRSYHNYMLERMDRFITFCVTNMTLEDVIDIRRTEGPMYEDFIVFNHFKDILDSYYEVMQNKVSIYARINDYGEIGVDLPPENGRVFRKDPNDIRKVKAEYSKCLVLSSGSPNRALTRAKQEDMERAGPIMSKFNMVFDSEYPDNESISKYMTISTNISKQKGVMLLTYGYSGTGKTFTLFGKKPQGMNPGKKGLLQSAIEGIRARSDIFFRVYEMYGAGLVYPFYWCQSVTEMAYAYHIDGGRARKDVRIDNFDQYIGKGNDIDLRTYQQIPAEATEKFFSNFSDIVESIDEIRKKKGRIKQTPNNPESSRSIIIYDLLITVKNELVKLTVIDLPGREEIVTTFTDDFIARDEAKYNTPYNRAVLSSMAINPLYLSILCPSLVFEAFNSLNTYRQGLCKMITDQLLDLDALDNCMIDANVCIRDAITKDLESQPRREGYHNRNVTFDQETVFVTTTKEPRTIGDIVNLDSRTSEFGTPFFTEIGKAWTNPRHMRQNVTDVQFKAVIAIHLLNRIILMKDIVAGEGLSITKFDVLKHIYAHIANKLGYRGLSDIAIAPFEGIYINENIVGLMKTLMTHPDLLGKEDKDAQNLIPPQKFKSFYMIKNEIRNSNSALYSETGSTIRQASYQSEYIQEDELDRIYRSNRDIYLSQNIYRFCSPQIEKVIDYYTNSEILTVPKNEGEMPLIKRIPSKTDVRKDEIFIGPIKDVKVFYLLSNNNQDLKCDHQYKLYRNTLGLMKIIDPVNN